jgi:hypothetical protein
LQGKSQNVLLTPNRTVNAGEVAFRPDRDHDGMPDDEEERNGTDPDDPSDADADSDHDGLTNGEEVARGSNPNSADTDGDGVSDGEEVALGFNPSDPNSTPSPTAALVSLQVTPNPINLTINSALGQDPLQLNITGVRNDGSTFNLTGSPTVTYESQNPNLVLVDDFGNVAAVAAGSTSIKVMSGAVFIDVPVEVTTFTAGTASELEIPGYANNVDVAGNYAYVAAGSAGLVVVNITDTNNPTIIATLDTPGNANDVRIVGTTAYIADGLSGLQIIDVSNPSTPVTLGSIDTAGSANDVVVRGSLAYVAAGFSGLRIIDISNPSAPSDAGSVDTQDTAWGVDVSGDFVVVADGTSVSIIDATTVSAPTVVGRATLPFGTAVDVEVRGRYAYVAVFGQGLAVVDFSTPNRPRTIANQFGFNFKDIALSDRHIVGAEALFQNFVPILDLNDPGNPFYTASIFVSASGGFTGTGLAVTNERIFETASAGLFSPENGTTGTSRLFILDYQGAAAPVSDTAGVAPNVSITSPQSGSATGEGDLLPISIAATDDVRVASVQLIVNDKVIAEDRLAPYDITYFAPHGVTSLVIKAKAIDTAGNTSTSAPVTVNLLPDPPPTVSIGFPVAGQQLYEQESLFLVANAEDNSNVAQIVFTINNQTFENFSSFTVPAGITSLTLEATATDDFGNSASTTQTYSVVPDPAPSVSIVAPPVGTELLEGQKVDFIADASDNLFLDRVELTINGELFTDFQEPFKQTYTVPVGITSLVFEVAGFDNLGQSTVVSRTFNVVPDPGTTVSGRVLDTSGQPIQGATAKIGLLTVVTGPDGVFQIPDVPTFDDVLVRVTASINGTPAANASLPTAPVRGGTTNVGDITLSILPTAPTAFALADFDGDFLPDVFVGYPDRQSLFYSLSNGELTPNPTLLPPYGAVTAAANIDLHFGNKPQLFVQLKGRPGSVTAVTFENGEMQAPFTVGTGLSGESEYIGAGVDQSSGGGSDFRAGAKTSKTSVKAKSVLSANGTVLAFLENGAGGTALTVRLSDDSPAGFTDPMFMAVDPSKALRTLNVADINNDGLMDVLVLKPENGTSAKLVVYRRTSLSAFDVPDESAVTVRAAVPGNGAIDYVLGYFVGDFNKDIAVIGDDGIRIYQGDGAGHFTSAGEIAIPQGTVVTGLAGVDLSGDNITDLLVTTRNSATPTARELRVYLGTTFDGFQSPTITNYTGPANMGDTRIGVGDFGGGFRQLDATVFDGDAARTLLDIGPARSSS